MKGSLPLSQGISNKILIRSVEMEIKIHFHQNDDENLKPKVLVKNINKKTCKIYMRDSYLQTINHWQGKDSLDRPRTFSQLIETYRQTYFLSRAAKISWLNVVFEHNLFVYSTMWNCYKLYGKQHVWETSAVNFTQELPRNTSAVWLQLLDTYGIHPVMSVN